MDSTNHRWKIFEKKGYIFVADMYYVVRPVIVVSVLNMYRHFLFCHHSLNNTTTFMAFTLYLVLYKPRDDLKYTGGYT